MRSADNATKRRETADFERPSPVPAGTSPSGSRTARPNLRVDHLHSIPLAKERLVMGRGNYYWQHEPCWYAVRGTGHWTGDRKQTTLWQIPTRADDLQDAATVHGTQKPVECMRRPMVNNSSLGQAVYEPFSGSGTTLIAAKMEGRACHAVELSPGYVAVAIQRWQAFTGQVATLGADGSSFAEVAAMRVMGKNDDA
jgi:hypothetical protein